MAHKQTTLLAVLRGLSPQKEGITRLIVDIEKGVFLPNTGHVSNAILAVRLDALGLTDLAKLAASNHFNECEEWYISNRESAKAAFSQMLSDDVALGFEVPKHVFDQSIETTTSESKVATFLMGLVGDDQVADDEHLDDDDDDS